MAARRLIPLLDRVLIERIVAPTKTSGGILLPESSVSKVMLADGSAWCHGLVISAASRRLRVYTDCCSNGLGPVTP